MSDGSNTALKFCFKKDIPRFVEDNTFRLSSSVYFRREFENMEVQSEAINDPNEGVSLLSIDIEGPYQSLTDVEKKNLAYLPIQTKSIGNAQGNLVISTTPIFMMFCMYVGNVSDGFNVFSNIDGKGNGYDACIEIPKMDEFCVQLREKNLELLRLDGQKMPTPPGGFWCNHGLVRYANTNATAQEIWSPANPLIKYEKFSHQSEWRFVLKCNDKKFRDDVDGALVHMPWLKDNIRVHLKAD